MTANGFIMPFCGVYCAKHYPADLCVCVFADIRKVLESMSSLGTRSAEEVAAVRKDYGLK